MMLRPGSRIGPHEVLGRIGAGGMEEVYRARDTRLNRDVALVDEDRNNVALYLDVDSQLTRMLLGSAAVRFERYSDFGSTVTGKLSARANVSDQFSLRGTVSTGFRAPGVQQKFFSLRSTNLNAAGVLTDTLTARQDSDVTRDFGIPPLKEETSRIHSGIQTDLGRQMADRRSGKPFRCRETD